MIQVFMIKKNKKIISYFSLQKSYLISNAHIFQSNHRNQRHQYHQRSIKKNRLC